MKMDFEITEWVENERIRLVMASGASLKSYEQLWMLAPTDSGSAFTFCEEIIFPLGLIGKLVGFVVKASSSKLVVEMQSKLKALAEAGLA